MIGMFIFGGKKEKKRKKSYEETLKEAEERFGVPADTVKELANIYVLNAGLPRLVRHAHPEKDLEHVMKITGSVDRGNYIYIYSIRDAKWREKAMEIKDPRAVKFVLLHPFIALILSHHSAAETSAIGTAVSDAINVFYGHMGKTYEDAKKEQDMLIDYIIKMAEYNHIPIVKDKLREQLKQGIPKAFKIVDKLLPDNSKEHAKLLKDALNYDVKDPSVLLKQAGIDIEPELEEFRQFLAEISGKKIEEKPKFPQVQKQVEQELKARGVPEEDIYRELEKAGIPAEVAKVILDHKVTETTPTEMLHQIIEQHVDRDPRKAKALLDAMEKTGKVVPVPKYWAKIVSKMATGEIAEKELLEALAISKVFHTAYSKALAKAAEMDEPENTIQKMAFIKRVLEDAHRETMEALEKHPVYGEHVQKNRAAIEQEIKAVAEDLRNAFYAKARGDPSLSARTFLQRELGPTVETLAPVREHLKKVNEDFLAMGRPQEETIAKAYPEIVANLTRLGTSPFAEKDYVGITHKHETARRKLKEIAR